jgi:hypothetical protein
MKTTKLFLTVFVMLCLCNTGHGQLGNLKNLGKNVSGNAREKAEQKKEDAKEQVEQKKDNAVSQASSPEANNTGNPAVNSITNPTEPGGIIFSSSPINPEQPVDLKTAFQAGDKIYAVAYLPKTVRELYENSSPTAKLQVEVFVYEIKPPLYSYQQPSEQQLDFTNMWVTGSIKDQKYLVVDLAPDPATTTLYKNKDLEFKEFGKKYDGPAKLAEALGKLASGKHNLKVLVKCYYADVAKGDLTISGENFSVYTDMAQQLNTVAASAAAAGAVFPKAVVTDAAREAKMVAAFKNSNDWKTGFIDGTEVLKTAITYDWEIRRHEISGAILHRYCIAAIAFKTKAGGCAYRKVTFQEDYVGGKFQPLRYDGAGDKVMMDCANLK